MCNAINTIRTFLKFGETVIQRNEILYGFKTYIWPLPPRQISNLRARMTSCRRAADFAAVFKHTEKILVRRIKNID